MAYFFSVFEADDVVSNASDFDGSINDKFERIE